MKISESDWRKFKTLRTEALKRFARRVLDEGQAICRNDSETSYERYLELYELVRERDREFERIFGCLHRSTAFVCLKLMHHSGLISDEELSGLSAGVRRTLAFR